MDLKDVFDFPLEYDEIGRKEEIWEFDLETRIDQKRLLLRILDTLVLAMLGLLALLLLEEDPEMCLDVLTGELDTRVDDHLVGPDWLDFIEDRWTAEGEDANLEIEDRMELAGVTADLLCVVALDLVLRPRVLNRPDDIKFFGSVLLDFTRTDTIEECVECDSLGEDSTLLLMRVEIVENFVDQIVFSDRMERDEGLNDEDPLLDLTVIENSA